MTTETAPFSWSFLETALQAHSPSKVRVSGGLKGSGLASITSDSRKAAPGVMFVALPGEKFDGHSFIKTAIEAGASAILCRHGTDIPLPLRERCRIFEVTDTQEAYRALGAAWRLQFTDIPVIVVAGSVGKTTTKELLAALLEGKFPGKVLKTQGSQNGFVGIPMTLLELRKSQHQAAVVEVGIDEPHTMKLHMDIVRGSHSVLTTIGPEHLEKLIDLPTVAREEAFALEVTTGHGGRAAVNLDDPWIAPLATTLPRGKIRTYSLSQPQADVRGTLVSDTLLEVMLEDGSKFELPLPLPGEHHARNLLAATVLALEVGLTPKDIQAGLARFKGAKGRTEIREAPGGVRIIADHYNANPSSMEAAFGILKSTHCTSGAARYACLGDMLELGADEEKWHRDLAGPLMAAGPGGILLYGPRMRWLQDELKKCGYRGNLAHFDSHSALADFLKMLLNHGDLVLIKGSRGMRMENVLDSLLPPRAAIVNPAKDGLSGAAALLKAGEVVGMPTETVYGLAGNALDQKALTRIFSTKERPTFDPLIVHITPELLDRALPDASVLDALDALGLVNSEELTDLARASIETLTAEFWPGPLTLVLPKGPRIPDLVCAGLPHVGLRMPAHTVARALINEATLPLAAPSANRFGRISPTSAHAVEQELGDRIPMIVDGGTCDIGLESTVISITPSGEPVMLRPGGISRESISEILGTEVLTPTSTAASEAAPQAAPGMLESHYAPRKPLSLLPSPLAKLGSSELQKLAAGRKIGILLQAGVAPTITNAVTLSLSASGDRAEAARNLFKMLRELDSSDAEILFAEPVSSRDGLDHAIADRLTKAAAPRK